MKHGDVLWLAPGQTDIDGQLLVPSGVMITGASRHRSTLSFHTASFNSG